MSKKQEPGFNFGGTLVLTFEDEGITTELFINKCHAFDVNFSFEEILQARIELTPEHDREEEKKRIAQSLRKFLKTLED